MRTARRTSAAVLSTGLLLLLTALPALAHDQPDGANWLMADWMLLSWFAFFVAGLLAFLVALKRGLMSNPEKSKYYLLEIDEPDYYTPDWARDDKREEGDDGSSR